MVISLGSLVYFCLCFLAHLLVLLFVRTLYLLDLFGPILCYFNSVSEIYYALLAIL